MGLLAARGTASPPPHPSHQPHSTPSILAHLIRELSVIYIYNVQLPTKLIFSELLHEAFTGVPSITFVYSVL